MTSTYPLPNNRKGIRTPLLNLPQSRSARWSRTTIRWGTRIRTKNDRTRICSVTITPYPNFKGTFLTVLLKPKFNYLLNQKYLLCVPTKYHRWESNPQKPLGLPPLKRLRLNQLRHDGIVFAMNDERMSHEL